VSGCRRNRLAGRGSAGYSHPGDAGDTVAGISPYRKHLNIHLYQGMTLSDPAGLLQGTGKQMRHVKISRLADLENPALLALLEQAWAKGKTRSGDGETMLEKVREICRSLPEVVEISSHGHPSSKVGTKCFLVFGSYMGLGMRVGKDLQASLIEQDSRYYPTPYMGHQGWVSLKIEGQPDLNMAAELIVHIYRQVANKRQLQALEAR